MRQLGDPFTAAERRAVVTAARSWMHVPWRHQGRNRRGIDCVGLVVLSFDAVRHGIPDQRGYLRTPFNRRLRAALQDSFGAPVAGLQPADVVTLAWLGEEHHVAIVTDHPEGLGLIHCHSHAPGVASGGRVVEHRLSDDWRNRIVEIFRP